METRSPSSPQLDALRIVFLLAACFAIGAIGFFLAVFLQRTNTSATAGSNATQQQLDNQQKENILQSLSASQQPSTNTSAISSGTSSAGSVGRSSAPSPSTQTTAQQNAEKLKILESLNSSN